MTFHYNCSNWIPNTNHTISLSQDTLKLVQITNKVQFMSIHFSSGNNGTSDWSPKLVSAWTAFVLLLHSGKIYKLCKARGGGRAGGWGKIAKTMNIQLWVNQTPFQIYPHRQGIHQAPSAQNKCWKIIHCGSKFFCDTMNEIAKKLSILVWPSWEASRGGSELCRLDWHHL